MEVIKGRMYDYNNGRFLSVDPFIQSPSSTQSMNPYTYIFNNPLSGIDPTGYMSVSSRFQSYSGYCGQGLGCVSRSGDEKEDHNGIVAIPVDSLGTSAVNMSDTNSKGARKRANPRNHSQKLNELKSKQLEPESSPLPITTITPDGQTKNLILMHDGLWHDVGDNELSNVNNQYIIGSDGLAHRVSEKGLATVTPIADAIAIVTGGILVKKGFQAGLNRLLKSRVQTGYHATLQEVAPLIQENGFRQGVAPGRLGSGGTYVNNTREGAIAEFQFHNPGITPTVLKVEYNFGINASTRVAPKNYVERYPFNQVDSISAPSVRAPGTVNTNVLNNSVRVVD